MNRCILMLLTFLIAFLSGCGVIAQRQNDADIKKLNQIVIDEIAAEPKMKLLEGKIALPPKTDWTLAQLADTSYPDAAQKDALSVYDGIATRNNARVKDFLANEPAMLPIMNDYMNETQNNRLALYQGKITFGEYNQYSKKLFEVRQNLLANLSRITQEQQRQAWANAMNSMSESFQRAATNRPINTNCYSNGSYTNCTTN